MSQATATGENDDEVPAARGSSSLYCFVMGAGEFQDGEISENLTLRVDSAKHGVVVPLLLVSIDRFQADLAATREHWTVDGICSLKRRENG
jgi:hypothetical protein